MAAAKRYAPKQTGQPAPVHDFVMVFLRDGVEEEHEFTAKPRMGFNQILGIIKTQDDERGRMLPFMDKMLRGCLVNDDGTPLKWSPHVVTPEPADEGTEPDDPWFTDPDGNHAPVEDIPKWEAFEAGSSRRRWAHLMDVDDELTIESEQVTSLFNDMIALVTERPTKRSSHS